MYVFVSRFLFFQLKLETLKEKKKKGGQKGLVECLKV
jgi:hypothetical protein